MQVRTVRDLGAAVKQTRRERGLSQAGLAREVGVHQPKISAVERGAPGVRVELVLQILRTLDLVISVEAGSKPASKPASKRARKKEPDDLDLDAIANTGLDR